MLYKSVCLLIEGEKLPCRNPYKSRISEL